MSPLAGYPSGTNNNWSLAQWSTSNTLNPSVSPSLYWANANNAQRVQYQTFQRVSSYQLAQNGAGLDCGVEANLFLGNGGDNGFVQSQPLSALGSVLANVGLNIEFSQLTPQNSCSTLQAGYLYSVILSAKADPVKGYPTPQTIFYQIDLGTSNSFRPNISWCPSYETSNDGNFCLDDDIANVGGTYVTTGSTVMNSADLLPRILQILKTNHKKSGAPSISLNPNPQDWTITSIYVGSHVWGNAQITSNWYNVSLQTIPGGSFCNTANNTMIQYSCSAGQPLGSGWNNVGGGCYQRNSGATCQSVSLP
jgi:hypothetical protein